MKFKFFVPLIPLFLLFGCANPINKVTSANYAAECSSAESSGNLKVAEEACKRALMNTDWGNLGSELKSQSLYNLGRIKRQLSKFSEAEQLFKESLDLEEQSKTPDQLKIGRRLVELSVSLAGQNKWQEGAQYLVRVLPHANNFSGKDKSYTIEVLNGFSEQLRKINQEEIANKFQAKAKELTNKT